jgi:putative lipoprotein
MKKNIFWLLGLSALALLLGACSVAGGLDATSWGLQSYADPTGELVDVLPRSVVTLNFQANQVSGLTGCNNYSGSYQATGSKIKIGPLAATEKACLQPAGIMAQEDAYLAALNAAADYNLRANKLEMKNGQGQLVLVFVRATGD